MRVEVSLRLFFTTKDGGITLCPKASMVVDLEDARAIDFQTLALRLASTLDEVPSLTGDIRQMTDDEIKEHRENEE